MCKARFTIVALLVAMLAGCATTDAPEMRVDYDRKADFSVYRTFGFPKETGTDRGGYSTLVTSYFKSSVTTAMEACVVSMRVICWRKPSMSSVPL